MTPTEFLAALAAIGWRQSTLADRLRCDTNLPTRWARGEAEIPPAVASWLRAMERAHARLPAPQDWRRRAA